MALPKCGREADVHACPLRAYPLLEEGGGFTLMITDNKISYRHLVPLHRPYHVESITEQVEYQVIYVRPLQNNLGSKCADDDDGDDDKDEDSSEAFGTCKSCKIVMAQTNLESHIKFCGRNESEL